jgi:glutamine cyclotransferase
MATRRRRPPAAPAPRRRGGGRTVWIVAAGAIALTGVLYLSAPSMPAQPRTPPPRSTQVPSRPATPVLRYELVRDYPHDPQAFTQGLVFHDGVLFESTGQYGQSSVRRVELETGKVLQERRLEAMYFGEGLALWGTRLLQLTWQANVGFVYDLGTFDRVGTFPYPGEGWGITADDRRLIMSDGTASLRFLDPETQRETGRITVTGDAEGPIHNLNELEYVSGDVYANVWGSDRIAVIDPDAGRLKAWIDLDGILRPSVRTGREDVLNGIAYDASGGRLFVTGKYWPRLFEIRVLTDSAR